MSIITSFVNVIAGASVLLGGKPFMDDTVSSDGPTLRKVIGAPLLAIGGLGILMSYVRNRKVREDKKSESYGAESFSADSLKGRWKDGTTRMVHEVSVTKTPMGERYPDEKPEYRLSYNGQNARLYYEGVAFYLPCWEYRSYGNYQRYGCFNNPMEAILSFKMQASQETKNAESFESQLSFDRWSKDEMDEELHGGRDMNFEDWLDDEIDSHGKGISLKRWGDEEEGESEHQHAEYNR